MTRKLFLETPCSTSEIEEKLHIISYAGHWHDAVIKTDSQKIVFEYEEEETADSRHSDMKLSQT